MIEADKTQLAALFAAPEYPGEATVAAADPMHELDEVQRNLVRLRNMPINEIIGEYLGVRDNLDAKRHEWQALESELKGKLQTMSMVMREKADTLGVDSFPVRGLGTAYRNIKTSVRIADWDSYWKWLVATGNSQCVEKRPAKLAVLEVAGAMGELPPGLEKIEEVEFTVRRAK